MIRKDVAGEVAGCLKCLYAGITVPPFDASRAAWVKHRDVVYMRPIGTRSIISTSSTRALDSSAGGKGSSSAIRLMMILPEGDAAGGERTLTNGCTITLQGKEGFLSGVDGKFRSPSPGLSSQWVVHATNIRRPRGGEEGEKEKRIAGFYGSLQELRIYRAPIGRLEAQALSPPPQRGRKKRRC
jgi:hypothetical protein